MTDKNITDLFNQPLMPLLQEAIEYQKLYLKNNNKKLEKAMLVNIKEGGCPENCHFCSQASRYFSSEKKNSFLDNDFLEGKVRDAIKNKADRICLVGAWRSAPKGKTFDLLVNQVKKISSQTNLNVCCCFGFLTKNQAIELKKAGAYAYNHNLQAAESFYPEIVSTHDYKKRLETISYVASSEMQLCSGVILGMGETLQQRVEVLQTYANFEKSVESFPINCLIPIKGTPLEGKATILFHEFLQFLCIARLVLPNAEIRLSAGRENFSESEQLLSLLAGVSSFFVGDDLLTVSNKSMATDNDFFQRYGI